MYAVRGVIGLSTSLEVKNSHVKHSKCAFNGRICSAVRTNCKSPRSADNARYRQRENNTARLPKVQTHVHDELYNNSIREGIVESDGGCTRAM